jgi:hypothetical protein
MLVKAIQEIEFNALRADYPDGFPMQDRPPLGVTDAIGENAATAFPQYDDDGRVVSGNDEFANNDSSLGGIEFDPLAKVIYPRSLFVLHDNILSTYGSGYTGDTIGPDGLPVMDWYDFATDSEDYEVSQVKRSPGFTSLRFDTTSPASFIITGNSSVSCQGFTAFLRLGGPQQLTAPCYAAVRFRVSGSSRGAFRWYSVSYKIGIGLEVAYNDFSDDGTPQNGTWVPMARGKMGNQKDDLLTPGYVSPADATDDMPEQEAKTHVLDVRLIAGSLRLFFGDEQTPLVFPSNDFDDYGIPDFVIDRWQIAAAGVMMTEWSVHETKWYVGAATVSQDVNLGFVPSNDQLNNIKFRTHYLPNDYTFQGDSTQVGFTPKGSVASASIQDVTGTVMRYRIDFSNPLDGTYQGIPYSDFTSAVNAVSFDFPGQVFSVVQAPVILGTDGAPPMPESIDISHEWDQSVLSVRSRANLTFNNFYGHWTNANNNGYIDSNGPYPGHFFAAINLGIQGFGPNGAGVRREFTGIGGRDFVNNWQGGGRDKLTITCEDRWAMLDYDVFVLPWFDGWNIYAVLAFLLAIGTVEISPTQMGFYDLIPFDDNGFNPYLPSPGLPDDEQYFMPSGPAGTNLTRYDGGQNLRSILLKITNAIGFYCFFDVAGVAQTGKFQIQGVNTKTFTHIGTPTLQEIFTGEFRGSLRETRNSVTVIGVNALGPLWYPIVAHSIDTDSIYVPTAFNYIGWHNPLVWVDSIFANIAFAQSASDALYAFLRLPDRTVSFTTWYPGDALVYPTCMITINYPRSAVSGFSFFVTATRTSMRQGQNPTMTISGRIVPGSLGTSV